MKKLLIFILAFAAVASAGVYSLDSACYNIGKTYVDNIGTCKYNSDDADWVRFTCKSHKVNLIKVNKHTSEMIIFLYTDGGRVQMQIYSNSCGLFEYDEYDVLIKTDTFLNDENAKFVYSYFKSTLNK